MYEFFFWKCLYPFYETTLNGRKTFRYFDQYLANQKKSREEINEIQLNALSNLLVHCYTHVPYYRKTWESLDIHPSDISSLEQFAQLPVLTKEIVRENYTELIADNYTGKTITKTTGGSTGKPFQLEITRESYERRTAVAWRGYSWTGAMPGQKTVYLWGVELGKVPLKNRLKNDFYNLMFNRKYLNSFQMTKSNLREYCNKISKYKPKTIVAYVSPMHTLAEYIIEHDVPVYSPDTIITGAEPLYEHQREAIETRAMAAVLPWFEGCLNNLTRGSEYAATMVEVESVDPSSTTTISFTSASSRTRSSTSPIVASSLKAGTRTLTRPASFLFKTSPHELELRTPPSSL